MSQMSQSRSGRRETSKLNTLVQQSLKCVNQRTHMLSPSGNFPFPETIEKRNLGLEFFFLKKKIGFIGLSLGFF